MNQTVKNFIDQKNEEYEAAKKAENQRFFDSNNLSQRVYMDEEVSEKMKAKDIADKYPYYDYSNGTTRRYRIVYPDFTDAEIEEMKRAQERVDAFRNKVSIEPVSIKEKSSTLATVLVVLAVVIYLGTFVAGIIAGQNSNALDYYSYRSSSFDFGTAIIFWCAGLFSGTMMLGFAEIVDNLNMQTKLLRAILKNRQE